MASVDLSVSGLASGFDWKTVVTQLAQAERSPETGWLANQTKLNQQSSVYNSINSYLNNVQAYAKTLMDPTLYEARSVSSSAATVATATASAGALTGAYNFNITQLATTASLNGVSGISQSLDPGNDPGAITVGAAGFATAVTAGSFTVNGAQVTIATTDSLQSVFDKIAAATGNAVTASYASGTDTIKLASATTGNKIVLGSATDTSNFLQVAKLYNNNSDTVSSTGALGRVNTAATLSAANLKTAVTDGGGGAGAFTVNGVTVNYNASKDSVQDVLDRINESGAGVNAQYDVSNNRFLVSNKATGDVGIALQDVTGNFLAATGLGSGTLTHGKNLLYSINSGPSLVSQSNTIDGTSSGINGLSVTALTTGAANFGVSTDTSAITTAVQNFVNAYNTVQGYITTQSASTTDSSGKVTAGTLTGDQGVAELAASLRTNVLSSVSVTGLSQTFSNLAALGVKSSGYSNTVTLDTATLASALTTNLSDVKKLFSDSTSGLAARVNTYMDKTVGEDGTIASHRAALTTQSDNIDKQIASLEKQITADAAFWTSEFQAMETASSKSNQTLTYLTQSISNGTL